ncbi:hypothetical protein OIDMADRAFT_47758 [Oidiodendron maius Zn]|uniref:Channel forming colicins domain-containing protein n=1 Tax=Oidiodendron maius (strain Zn) TaxID=913774 RepID=A0A0C3I0A2_OIDMZ|nr:hypothetical protein OIDMADRAFT_47758 [Oidiodendron maius Zn]
MADGALKITAGAPRGRQGKTKWANCPTTLDPLITVESGGGENRESTGGFSASSWGSADGNPALEISESAGKRGIEANLTARWKPLLLDTEPISVPSGCSALIQDQEIVPSTIPPLLPSMNKHNAEGEPSW